MTSVQSRGSPRKERISEAPSKPLLLAGSDYKGAISHIIDPDAGPV